MIEKGFSPSDVEYWVSDITDTKTLENHIKLLDELASHTGHDPEPAKQVVLERLGEIEQRAEEAMETRFLSSRTEKSDEKFYDADLRSLFKTRV